MIPGAKYRPKPAYKILRGEAVVYQDEWCYLREKHTNADGMLSIKLERLTDGCDFRINVFPTVTLPVVVSAPFMDEKSWPIHSGDVVLYDPDRRMSTWSVAIRSATQWFTSASRGSLRDARVRMDVALGRAHILRSAARQEQVDYRRTFGLGSVVAVADPACPDPSAWLHVERDLWRSTIGVEMSDAMIRHELMRGTYRLIHYETRGSLL